MERLCSTAERGVVLAALLEMSARSREWLLGLGVPFAFPAVVAGPWEEQLETVRGGATTPTRWGSS